MKKSIVNLLFITMLLVMVLSSGIAINSQEKNVFTGDSNEEYYFVTFLTGIEYFKGLYQGFEDAGKLYGVKTIYTGTPEYDVDKEVTVFNQIVAKKPAGIAVAPANPKAFEEPIRLAMEKGITVLTCDADSPQSQRYSFLGTGNYDAGVVAARYMANLINEEGEVAVLYLPGLFTLEERTAGFKDTIEKDYPNMKVVKVADAGGDQTTAAKAMSSILQANSDLKGVFCPVSTAGVGAATVIIEAKKVGKIQIVSFDSNRGTLDLIKEGVISATIVQNSWNMGFWSMNFLYFVKHDLANPVKDWKKYGMNPLPPSVNTGVQVVTKENADIFYTSE
jgi:ribose transport system substrate-binding protein